MRGTPTDFWGKLETGPDGLSEWHPLSHHCADVAAVAECLLALPLWRRRLARLAGRDLTPIDCARLAALAFLHDLGKFNHGFQRKAVPGTGSTAGHVREAVAALSHLSCLQHLNSWGDATFDLLVAALCHHGRPYAWRGVSAYWQEAWWAPDEGRDPVAGVSALVEEARGAFPLAFAPSALPLPTAPEFGHAFAGLVTLADWLGSDTRFFPFSKSIDEARISESRFRARLALDAIGLSVPPSRRKDSQGRSPFGRIAPPSFVPRVAQAAMQALPVNGAGSLTILESETGSGKTEAALSRFVALFEAGEVDGLYFALPTRAASTEIHGRVLAAVRRAFAQPPPVILAVPGYLRVDDTEGRKLPDFGVLWPDQDRFRYRGWTSENAKRFIAGCVVVGTVDQVLLSSLRVNHAHLRAAPLLRHLIVVDEVHASDEYMTRILAEVLLHHRAAGGHALLLSATLGAEARGRLLGRPDLAGLGDALAHAYPTITHMAEEEHRTICIVPDGPEKAVAIEIRPWLESHEEVARRAVALASRGARVLVIKNTVADCILTQVELEKCVHDCGRDTLLFRCAGQPAPHHARFAREDRVLLDRALESEFGPNRESGGRVVIATQTAQQSLDLDADVLLSDLCPADVLLQRVGRMHRHRSRSRPEGFERARVLVLVPEKRDLTVLLRPDGRARHHHGLGSVYSDLRILEATWRMLEREPEWRIPSMSRQIVEGCVHSQVLEEIAQAGGEHWSAHAVGMTGGATGRRRLAALNVVDWSVAFSETTFPDNLDERIMTRLGEGDRRAKVVPSVVGPFGIPINELTLRAAWVRGADSTLDRAEHVVALDGSILFTFGGRDFIYDRLGLRPANMSTSAEVEDAA